MKLAPTIAASAGACSRLTTLLVGTARLDLEKSEGAVYRAHLNKLEPELDDGPSPVRIAAAGP
jgi:hypothetical protein